MYRISISNTSDLLVNAGSVSLGVHSRSRLGIGQRNSGDNTLIVSATFLSSSSGTINDVEASSANIDVNGLSTCSNRRRNAVLTTQNSLQFISQCTDIGIAQGLRGGILLCFFNSDNHDGVITRGSSEVEVFIENGLRSVISKEFAVFLNRIGSIVATIDSVKQLVSSVGLSSDGNVGVAVGHSDLVV